jgi:uncharacterized membrane protein YdjX (TVP38/TMEM64 family)
MVSGQQLLGKGYGKMKKEGRNNWLRKAAVIGLLLIGIAVFNYLNVGQYLSLGYINASQDKFQTLYQSHQVLVIGAYMGLYIVVTALSLPGAAVMTLAGGGLFGLTVGTMAISFASTIGATLACFISRFLLRDWVQHKFGDKLAAINTGIEKEGAFYLFSLRLVPIFPFFVINLVMGLTRMRLFTFFWVSQIGMLAGTLVYVNAGKELAKIDSLSGILSPGVLASFAVLGLFPITVKKLLGVYKRKFKTASDTLGKGINGSSIRFILVAVLLSTGLITWTGVANAESFDQSYAGFDALLKRFVSDGRVDYNGLRSDPQALVRYLEDAAGVEKAHFNDWMESERLSFLINLYNAATLKLIVDHYPVRSIKKIGSIFRGPWDQRVVRLFGEVITLNNLEHDIIRKQYNEPRIHLALVCAAKGCPKLRSEAYVAERLDGQLDDQSRDYLSSPAGLHIDRGRQIVYFSSIFKWYGEDFITGYSPASEFSGLDQTERAVANFSSRYLSAPDRNYLKAGGYSVKYLDYDWSLNEWP